MGNGLYQLWMDDAQIPPSWQAALAPVLARPQARELVAWLRREEASGKEIYPPAQQRLAALELTGLDRVKVVILGQDPYHGPGQAHGLAFSVQDGVRVPPSLANIYKELHEDLGVAPRKSGDLRDWASQGVLLINAVLSVEAGKAGSHQKRGWEEITDAIVGAVAARQEACVFILWGSHAQKKARNIAQLTSGERHLVIRSPHPSPLSAYRGFFGSRPFSKANDFLAAHGHKGIHW